MSAFLERHRPFLLALVLGLAGGIGFALLSVPLPWMLGSMLVTTVASLTGLKLRVPGALRTPMLAMLGVLLGSGFSRELGGQLLGWLPTIAVLPFYLAAIAAVNLFYLAKVTRFDARSAFFAAAPGGFGEMVLLGDRFGGDMRRISLVHAVRVLLIVVTVPIVVQQMGLEIGAGMGKNGQSSSLLEVALLLGAAGVGGWLGGLLRLPAPGLIGGMVMSAALHLLGWVEGTPPVFLIALAQLVIGSSIGARFSGFPMLAVLHSIVSGVGLTVLMLTVTLLIGIGVHLLLGSPVILVMLALMPGGVAEMSLIALALGIDPAFVATHHLIRISLIVVFAPIVFAKIERFFPARADEPE